MFLKHKNVWETTIIIKHICRSGVTTGRFVVVHQCAASNQSTKGYSYLFKLSTEFAFHTQSGDLYVLCVCNLTFQLAKRKIKFQQNTRKNFIRTHGKAILQLQHEFRKSFMKQYMSSMETLSYLLTILLWLLKHSYFFCSLVIHIINK